MYHKESNQEFFCNHDLEYEHQNQFPPIQPFYLDKNDCDPILTDSIQLENHQYEQTENINYKIFDNLSQPTITNFDDKLESFYKNLKPQDIKPQNLNKKINNESQQDLGMKNNINLTKQKIKKTSSQSKIKKFNQYMLKELNSFAGFVFQKFKNLIQQNKNQNFDFNKSNSRYLIMFIKKIPKNREYQKIFQRLISFMEITNSHSNGILYMMTSLQKITNFTNKLDDPDFQHYYKQVVDSDLMTVFTKSSNHTIPSVDILKNILLLKQYKKSLLKILVSLAAPKTQILLQKLSQDYQQLPRKAFQLKLREHCIQKANIQKIIKEKSKRYINKEVFREISQYQERKRKQSLKLLLLQSSNSSERNDFSKNSQIAIIQQQIDFI